MLDREYRPRGRPSLMPDRCLFRAIFVSTMSIPVYLRYVEGPTSLVVPTVYQNDECNNQPALGSRYHWVVTGSDHLFDP